MEARHGIEVCHLFIPLNSVWRPLGCGRKRNVADVLKTSLGVVFLRKRVSVTEVPCRQKNTKFVRFEGPKLKKNERVLINGMPFE